MASCVIEVPCPDEQDCQVYMWDVVFAAMFVIGDVIDNPPAFDMNTCALQIERTLSIRNQKPGTASMPCHRPRAQILA